MDSVSSRCGRIARPRCLLGVAVSLPETAAELVATNVSVTFPARGGAAAITGLSDITCTLRHGDRVAILGRNGSGKSTLLRTLAGIYVPTCGHVARKGKVQGLFDFWVGLHLDATGRENALMLGLLQGRTSREIGERYAAIRDMAELEAAIDRPVRGWSPGMMLRLSFAVATAWQSDIFLVDEVLSVADVAFCNMARQRLMDMAGTSSIIALASHDQDLLRAVGNRALVLEGGRLMFDGAIEAGLAYYEQMHAEAAWKR